MPRCAWPRTVGSAGGARTAQSFPVEVGLNPIQTRKEISVLGAIVDIRDRLRMERLKDEFVATVSHELRNSSDVHSWCARPFRW